MVSLEENFSLAGVSHVWTWASESYVVLSDRLVTPSGGTTNHLSSQPTTLAPAIVSWIRGDVGFRINQRKHDNVGETVQLAMSG